MAEDKLLEFGNILYKGKGVVRLNSTGVAWKAKRSGESVAVIGEDLKGAEWLCLGPQMYQLVLRAKRGVTYKFNGFKQDHASSLHSALKKYFSVQVKQVELSTLGHNWGTVKWQDNSLSFIHENDKKAFDLPLTSVQQSFNQKDVVTIEFQQDAKPKADADSLVEMRFVVKGEELGITSGEFLDNILKRADISSTSGGGLLAFSHLPMLTPRGRYDVEFFDSHMRFHGKTYNYKIVYKMVQRVILLPKPDEKHICSVISLNPPARQGHTTYPHIVLQFDKNSEVGELTLNAEKDDYRSKYKAKGLKRQMTGKTYKVFHKALSALADKPVHKPARSFESFYSAKAVKCSLKANDGFLFPLEKALIFIHKPPTYIRYSEISVVEFARISAQGTAMSGRTFDLVVSTRSGNEEQFTGIQRNEFKPLFDLLNEKKVNIKKIHGQEETGAPSYAGYDDEDDEEDDDFVPVHEAPVAEEFDEGDVPDEVSDDVEEEHVDEGDLVPEEETKKKKKKEKKKKKRKRSSDSHSKSKKKKKEKKEE